MIVVGFLSGGSTAATILIVLGLLVLSVGLVAARGSQGIERRARGRLAYLGPSPFLVFAAAIPISLLARPRRCRSRSSRVGVPVDGPLAALLSVAHPGGRLRRAGPAAGRRHRRPRLAGDGHPWRSIAWP